MSFLTGASVVGRTFSLYISLIRSGVRTICTWKNGSKGHPKQSSTEGSDIPWNHVHLSSVGKTTLLGRVRSYVSNRSSCVRPKLGSDKLNWPVETRHLLKMLICIVWTIGKGTSSSVLPFRSGITKLERGSRFGCLELRGGPKGIDELTNLRYDFNCKP